MITYRMLQTAPLFPKKGKNAKNSSPSLNVTARSQLMPGHKPFAQDIQSLHPRRRGAEKILKLGMIQSWVAASSAAWGWQNSQSGATIPKSFGFEDATRTAITLWPSLFQSRFSAGRPCNPPVSLPASHRRAPISAPPELLRFSPPACLSPPSPPARPAASEPC